MKSIEHFIEYYLLIVFAFFIRILPLKFARFMAVCLADFTYHIVGIRKKVVIKNLKDSFSNEKSEAEIRQIARNTYRQFSKTMMELLFFPKWKKEDIENLVEIEGKSVLDQAIREGRGAILVAGHFCNWELLGACVANLYPLSFVIGRQENSKVDDLLNSFRAGKNFKMIPLKVALRGVMQALRKKEFVAMLADQDAHEDGTFVNFFGRPSSTPKGPAVFAIRAKCPIIFSTIIRQKDKFKAIFIRLSLPAPTGNDEKDIQNYTQSYTSVLEKYCRTYPDHWFWMHRRWKTKKSN
ncbi:lysophospholipid acyltransferase family protein [Elusimicrobiota bacterium]